jgi:hypothetical protein
VTESGRGIKGGRGILWNSAMPSAVARSVRSSSQDELHKTSFSKVSSRVLTNMHAESDAITLSTHVQFSRH